MKFWFQGCRVNGHHSIQPYFVIFSIFISWKAGACLMTFPNCTGKNYVNKNNVNVFMNPLFDVIRGTYTKPCQTSRMVPFAKITNSWKLFTKKIHLRCLTGHEYNYDYFFVKHASVMTILIYFRDYWHRNKSINFIWQPF